MRAAESALLTSPGAVLLLMAAGMTVFAVVASVLAGRSVLNVLAVIAVGAPVAFLLGQATSPRAGGWLAGVAVAMAGLFALVSLDRMGERR